MDLVDILEGVDGQDNLVKVDPVGRVAHLGKPVGVDGVGRVDGVGKPVVKEILVQVDGVGGVG